MSIIGALGGLGDAAQRMGETNQKAWLDQDSEALKQKFQRELVDLQAQKQMALETFKNTLATNTKNTERTNMAAAIDQGAGGIVDTAMQGHGVADQSTWTPEQEAARNQGIVGMKNNPRTRIQAATNAGYIDEASKMDKIADSGAKTTPWGSVTHDSDGKVIYDNASELKGKIAQQGADAKGAIKRADHFDEKQWDAAAKVPQHVISLRDPNNPDKEIEITALRSAYMKQFNANKSSGEMSPNEAIEHATTTIGMLRDKAQEMVDKAKAADPKSTLTQEAAIKTILKRAAEAEKPRASLSVTPTSVPAKQAGEDGFSIERTNDGVKVYSNDIDRVFVGAKTLSDVQSKLASIANKLPQADADAFAKAVAMDKRWKALGNGDKSSEPQVDYERFSAEAKALEPKISELRTDYAQATSVRGGRNIDPEVPKRIKMQLDTAIKQQDALKAKAENAYMEQNRGIVNAARAVPNKLNSKYTQ